MQRKITEADKPTIWLGATPSRLISDTPPSFPHFYAGGPSCCNPPLLPVFSYAKFKIHSTPSLKFTVSNNSVKYITLFY